MTTQEKYKYPLVGAAIGFFAGLLIELVIMNSSQEESIILTKEYLKRTGITLIALDGGVLGGLSGFLYKIYIGKKK